MKRLWLGPLLLGALPVLAEEPLWVPRNDWGEPGILQMPSARFDTAGQFAVTVSHVDPYLRLSVFVTPLPWLEGGFRYTDIRNRPYGPEALSGNQSYKDKSIDLRVRLLEESALVPQVAVGWRDLGGTGLFSGEYLAASKRWGTFDVTAGLGWGYVGARGEVENPLGWVSEKFKTRPNANQISGATDQFGFDQWFRGPINPFFGVVWQPGGGRFAFKAEYDANDYQSEPLRNPQDTSSPINLGMEYRYSPNVRFSLGWERGNTAMVGIQVSLNLADDWKQPKFDPPPVRRNPEVPLPAKVQQVDWPEAVKKVEEASGFTVRRVALRPQGEVALYGEHGRYRDTPKGDVRAVQALDATVSEDVRSFALVQEPLRLGMVESGVSRQKVRDYTEGRSEIPDLHQGFDVTLPTLTPEETLYESPPPRLQYRLAPGLIQNVGGPDSFYLYSLTANLSVDYWLTDRWRLGSALALSVYNNFDKFRYDGPSGLPRVRTDIRRYLTTSDVIPDRLYLSRVDKLGEDLFQGVYFGWLEYMYAGAGGQWLYRPVGSNAALGANLNWVRQRDFGATLGLRDYDVLTGHVTGYYREPYSDILAKLSVGRYLAKDLGATLDVSRRFASGVEVGVWATLTDAGTDAFGEGSFDKGFYLTLPFDGFFTRSTRRSTTLVWSPLTRDGGQRLSLPLDLYAISEGRDMQWYHRGFNEIDR